MHTFASTQKDYTPSLPLKKITHLRFHSIRLHTFASTQKDYTPSLPLKNITHIRFHSKISHIFASTLKDHILSQKKNNNISMDSTIIGSMNARR
jgi:hypothetical protein